MKERTYTIRGVAPLVMHNERLSDPLDKWTRLVAQISKKQKKTEDDLMELSRREWFGGLYLFGPKEAPGVPERNLERMLRDAASKTKRGKDVQSACIVTEPAMLVYEGPKNAEALWESGKFLLRASCKVGQMRVIRSRPMFSEWGLTFTVNYDELVLEPELVDGFVELAGSRIGLCDWRPKHGRFIVEKVQ
jgi:hypothetical protein